MLGGENSIVPNEKSLSNIEFYEEHHHTTKAIVFEKKITKNAIRELNSEKETRNMNGINLRSSSNSPSKQKTNK